MQRLFSNWILTSCRPHRATSRRTYTGISQCTFKNSSLAYYYTRVTSTNSVQNQNKVVKTMATPQSTKMERQQQQSHNVFVVVVVHVVVFWQSQSTEVVRETTAMFFSFFLSIFLSFLFSFFLFFFFFFFFSFLLSFLSSQSTEVARSTTTTKP